MSPATVEPPCRRPRHALLALVALWLALSAFAGPAPAAPVASAGGIEMASLHCKCGLRCRGASCCCGPHEAPSRPSAPGPSRADSRPCLDSAPCGDPGLPGAPSSAPGGKGAALAATAAPPPVAPGSYLPPSSHRIAPSRRASRLDEPPERLFVA